MPTKRDFQVIIKNTDMDDPDELRDVLAMLAQEADKNSAEIKRLKAALKRVNAMYPSTAEKSQR